MNKRRAQKIKDAKICGELLGFWVVIVIGVLFWLGYNIGCWSVNKYQQVEKVFELKTRLQSCGKKFESNKNMNFDGWVFSKLDDKEAWMEFIANKIETNQKFIHCIIEVGNE